MIYYSMTLSRKGNKAVVIRASIEALTAAVSPLQDAALATALLRLSAARHEGGTGGVLEDLTDTLVGAGRAFEVLVGADLLTDLLTLDKRVSRYSLCNESERAPAAPQPGDEALGRFSTRSGNGDELPLQG